MKKTRIIPKKELRKELIDLGIVSSIRYMSFENLLMILPIGVLSKKDIGVSTVNTSLDVNVAFYLDTQAFLQGLFTVVSSILLALGAILASRYLQIYFYSIF